MLPIYGFPGSPTFVAMVGQRCVFEIVAQSIYIHLSCKHTVIDLYQDIQTMKHVLLNTSDFFKICFQGKTVSRAVKARN
jgi:hypothetical protein